MRKKIMQTVSITLAITLMINFNPVFAKSLEPTIKKDKEITFLSKKSPNTADEYARNVIVDLLTNVVKNPNFYGVNNDIRLDNYTLGDSYTIFNVQHDGIIDDSEKYNYPVIVNNDIVLILSVMKDNNNKWSASIAKNEAEYLDELAETSNDSVILYSYDGVLYAETKDEQEAIMSISSQYTSQGDYHNSFINISYDEKKATFINDNSDIEEVDPYTDLIIDDSNRLKVENIYGYTPGFLIDTSYAKQLAFSSYAVTQNGYNLCWSACAATAINYRAGYIKYTAEDLATYLNIGYMSGGTLDNTKTALNTYGSQTYSKSTSTIPFSTIVSNIGTSKKPIVVGALTSNLSMGHMVLIVGYSTSNNTVQFYNPGTGLGGSSTTYLVIPSVSLVSFDFSYSGYTFTWKETVY